MLCRFLYFLFVLALSASPLLAGEELPLAEAKSNIQQRVDNGWNYAIAAGLIDAHQSQTFGYGKPNATSSKPVDGNTIFEIGSITKTFTSLLLAEMFLRDEVKLDDPVAKYLPAGTIVPEKDGKQISLLQLAQHSSGLPRMPSNIKPQVPANPYADYTPEMMYEFLKGCKLPRAPGESYEYSNLGAGLLGNALALKSGSGLEALFTSRICTELAMKDTFITLTPELRARLATGHNTAGVETANWDFSALAGCGALRSSVNDMLKYVGANMGLGETKLAAAISESHAHRFKINDKMEIALGWHITHSNGNELIWHNGGTGGYRSFIGFNANTHIGVALLTNSENGVDDIGMHLLDPKIPLDPSFARKRIEHREVDVDPDIFDAYAGEYELQPGFIITVTKKDKKLLAQATGQEQYQIYPESADEFFYKVTDAQIKFVKDKFGNVTHLVLHQAGLRLQANRAN